MECKKCGAPVAEGNSFCGKCGARVDGKLVCTACGKLNDEEHAFCVYCGAETQPKASKSNFKQGADIVANAVMLLGAVLSLIFVFFIGLKMQMDGQEEETMSIFYYFGEYAKEIKSLNIEKMDTTLWFINAANVQLTTAGVIGILLTALILTTTAVFSVIAIVKYATGWINGKHVNVEGWSLAAISCFLIGAVTYFAFNNVSVSGEGLDNALAGVNSTGSVLFNGETVTAIVLCAICVITSVVFRMIAEGAALWTKENIQKQIFAIISVIIAAAVFGVSQNFAFAFSLEKSGLSATLGTAYLPLSGGITIGMAEVFSERTVKGYYAMTNALAVMNNFSIFAAISSLAVAVFAGLALMESVRGVTEKEDKALLWSILALSFAVLTLVFSIFAVSGLAKVFNVVQDISGVENPENIVNGNFTAPILAVVFGVGLLIINLLKNKKTESVSTAERA